MIVSIPPASIVTLAAMQEKPKHDQKLGRGSCRRMVLMVTIENRAMHRPTVSEIMTVPA